MPIFTVVTHENRKHKLTYNVVAESAADAHAMVENGAIDEPAKEEFLEYISDKIVSITQKEEPVTLSQKEMACIEHLFEKWLRTGVVVRDKVEAYAGWVGACKLLLLAGGWPQPEKILEACTLMSQAKKGKNHGATSTPSTQPGQDEEGKEGQEASAGVGK